MNIIWMILFFCLLSFFCGFVSNYNQWTKRAKNGDLVEIEGKIYKIVEQRVTDNNEDTFE